MRLINTILQLLIQPMYQILRIIENGLQFIETENIKYVDILKKYRKPGNINDMKLWSDDPADIELAFILIETDKGLKWLTYESYKIQKD